MDLRNESRLIFAEKRNGQTRIQKLIDPNEMIFTNKGNFFVSEDSAGLVIRVRAKGRKTNDTDIITSMQSFTKNIKEMKIDMLVIISLVYTVKKGK